MEMTEKTKSQTLAKALKLILETAKDHSTFMSEEFEKRDTQTILDEGGDSCDWTFTAIYAEDALKETGML